MTLSEACLFAGAVIGPPWVLGILIASLYVAGPAFLLVFFPMAVHPVSLLVLALSLTATAVLVSRVHGTWTRPEFALVVSAFLATAMGVTPVVLLGDLAAGLPLGVVLVALGVAFGPIPLCFWTTVRATRSMRVAVDDPNAPSWLRDAHAWATARYEALRSRREPAPEATGETAGRSAVPRGERRR